MSGHRRASKRFWVHACLGVWLIVAAAILFLTKGLGSADQSRPVVLALLSDGSWIESAPFRASITSSYRASLSLERKYPMREMECLADVGSPFPRSTEPGRRTDCPPGFSPAHLEWSLIEEGVPANQTYDFGPHAGEYTSDTVGRSLGSFVLRSGRTYVVRARLSGAPTQLWATGPKLELAFDDMASLAVPASFFSLVAGVLGLVGLGLVIAALWRVQRDTQGSRAPARNAKP